MIEHFDIPIQEPVVDLMVSGFIDGDDTLLFHPMYDRIYFVFNDKIVQLYINDKGYITAKKIKKIIPWFNIEGDDRFSLMSIFSQAFKTEQEVVLSEIKYKKTPFSKMSILYKEEETERELIVDSNNFFGFSFL